LRRALLGAVAAALYAAATAAAAPPSQDVVLPGPVPYPTPNPPLVGKTAISGGFTRYVFHIRNNERVLVRVDETGSPSSLPHPQRLDVGGRVTLTVTNATVTPELEYAGTTQPRQIASLLDRTRRTARAGERLFAGYATFYGRVRQRAQKAQIEAPLRVEGELRVGSGKPVLFSEMLGDGEPLALQVHARGAGTPHVKLTATPVPVERLLRPPGGAPTWTAALKRRTLPGPFLLERLLQSRMRLVRADQYQSFLANPDADGRSRSVYVYETAKAPRQQAVAAPSGDDERGGGGPLVILLAIGGAIVAAGAGLVAWAHS